VNHIARIHQSQTYAPRDGRGDACKINIQFCRCNLRLVSLNDAAVLADGGYLAVQILT